MYKIMNDGQYSKCYNRMPMIFRIMIYIISYLTGISIYAYGSIKSHIGITIYDKLAFGLTRRYGRVHNVGGH